MKYITHKRFKALAICGKVNIPAATECTAINGVIYHDHKPVCLIASENAHLFFAVNDDGHGLERGHITQSILATLAAPASDNEAAWEKYTKLWDKVWADEVCKAYRRQGDADHWLWNHAFYNADIGTLNYIADLIGARR